MVAQMAAHSPHDRKVLLLHVNPYKTLKNVPMKRSKTPFLPRTVD